MVGWGEVGVEGAWFIKNDIFHFFIKYEFFISWQLDIFCMDYNAQIIYDKWNPFLI